jgi:hypothetical protein
MASKEDLLHFLDSQVFNPILRASPEDYGKSDRDKLKDAQERTKTEKERFRSYKNAEEVVTNFKRDLHSRAAKHVNQELERLKLPTLPSVRDAFLKEAGEG